MASGQINGPGGLGGSYLRLAWSSNPNTAGNYSDVYVTSYLELRGSTSLAATENGDVNIDGNTSGFSRGTTNRGPNGTHTMHSHSRRIYHNENGTKSIQIGGYFTSGWTTFGTINAGMSTITLDTIARYASINSFTLSSTNDQGFTINITANVTCDRYRYKINGGSWVEVSATGTSFTKKLNNLNSNTLYSVQVGIRRQSSGLWTDSGSTSTTTSTQDTFMVFPEL